jgi:excisionase family DNA binding protein
VSGAFLSFGTARAQDAPRCESAVLTLTEAAAFLRVDADDLERLARQGEVPARRIGSWWRLDCAALIAWLGGADRSIPGVPLTPGDLASAEGAGLGSRLPAQEEPIGEADEERVAEDVFLRGQRVLLGSGEVVMDFGQFYARNDVQDLAAAGSGIGLSTIEREALTTLLVARIGVFDETEVFASTSFHRQNTQQFLGSTRLASSSDNEFGGMRLGLRRTLLVEGPGRPDIILTVDGLLPRQNHPSDLGGGLVLVKSVDPVVLFASGTYHRSFRKDENTPTIVAPRDRVNVSLGYGLGLNDTLAISMSVSGFFAGDATFDGASVRQPDSFSASFGLTSWLAPGLYIEPSVSFGLTGPGDSFAVGLTIPYSF